MNPYFLVGAIVAVAIAGGAGYVKGTVHGKMVVQAEWDAERIRQQEAHAKALQEAIQKQQALQADADQLRQEKDRETRDLLARNTALNNSLRNRPQRPATPTGAVPSTAGTGSSGCTPRELYREDSEVVVGLAREADEIRLALKQCYAQYEAVRVKLSGGAVAGK
jgi:hypothetical protein